MAKSWCAMFLVSDKHILRAFRGQAAPGLGSGVGMGQGEEEVDLHKEFLTRLAADSAAFKPQPQCISGRL